ncbi:MAG: class I tRNA ligase family protein, partial [Candidatus Latescibacteria bacterium]|nr:class I tRNA ligase family protein [Candidatus Latescibacterota bacterium]
SKMSKSRGNVVSIEDMVTQYGADTARMFILFATPPDRDMEWSDKGVAGIHRFLHRVWRTISEVQSSRDQTTNQKLTRIMHQTIQAVTKDMERWQHNTAISRLMELTHAIQQTQSDHTDDTREACETLISLIAPFAPHTAEALWQKLGHTSSVHRAPWPKHDPKLAAEQTIKIAIQVNGKKRDTITIPRSLDESDIVQKAQNSQRVAKSLTDHTVQQTIYVPNRLVNFVTKGGVKNDIRHNQSESAKNIVTN